MSAANTVAPEAICTIATMSAWADLQLWLHSFAAWNNTTTKVYVMGDDDIVVRLKEYTWVHAMDGLQAYSGLTRPQMSRIRARCSKLAAAGRSLWDEFQLEKTTIMVEVLKHHTNVLFTDSDIVFLSPLRPFPSGTNSPEVILSPHYIRASDAAKYGYFNGGLMWTRNVAALQTWRDATCTSRFCEQAALEDVACAYKTAVLPPTDNFGWWRMFQADISATEQGKKFGIGEDGGIHYAGMRLTSVHTHFLDIDSSNKPMVEFNRCILALIAKSRCPVLRQIGTYILSMQAKK
jgi:hypothetical protein